ALRTKGNALQKLARYQDALDAYDQAIHLDPDNAENYKGKEQILEDERERLKADLEEKERKIEEEQLQRAEIEQALRAVIEQLQQDKEEQARQVEEEQLRRTELEQALKAKQPATTTSSRRFRLQLLVSAALAILVIISSISGAGIYQNHLNQVSNNAISTA